MDKIVTKNYLLERLRACPKLECNFWANKNSATSNNDGDVSEITYEDDDFWKRERSSLLLLAAKRFENNLHEQSKSSEAVTKELYDEDKFEETEWPEDESSASPNSNLLRSLAWVSFEDSNIDKKQSSSYVNFNLNQTPNSEHQHRDIIPALEPLQDTDESFSTGLSNDSLEAEKGSVSETDEMEELFRKMVNTSGFTASFQTPLIDTDAGTRLLDEPTKIDNPIQEITDVKIALSLDLNVDEYPETGFFSLLESLQSNKSIEKINVFRHSVKNGEQRTRSVEEMDNLFFIINNISQSLVELNLGNIQPEDLCSLQVGLLGHSSLQRLTIHMESGTIDEDLVKTIASNMPSLASLELKVHKSFPVWGLLESDSLSEIEVLPTGFGFESGDILRLANKMRINSTIMSLDLGPLIPTWCLATIMASLRFSHCAKLELFRFSCQNECNDEAEACMTEVLKTIDSKTAPLRILTNHCHESFLVSDDIKERTRRALAHHPRITHFHVYHEALETTAASKQY